MAKKSWWPSSMPAQLVLIQNFQAKFGNYATTLGFTAPQTAAAMDVCDAFIGAFNETEQCRQTMHAMIQWRQSILHGVPVGNPAKPAPVFPVVEPNTWTQGVVKQFFRLRDQIVSSANYTDAIGEDLGIVGVESKTLLPDRTQPQLKSVTASGVTINITGSMQGMDAMRVEYAPRNGEFSQVAFLTNTPGSFQVNPAVPGQPENGRIRAVYIKRNDPFGSYSAEHPVTLS